MSDYLALYRSYLTTEKRMSANTVSSYMRDLSQYDEWLKQKKTDLKRAKNVLLQEYVKRLEQLGKSPATMSRFLASSKSFYAYMFSKGYIKTNPTAALKAKKVQRKYPEILTNKEVELFWNSRSAWMKRAFEIMPCWSCSMPPASGFQS